MNVNGGSTHEQDHDAASDLGQAEAIRRMVDPCRPLAEEIEVLQEQIGVLEEGLPRAPGMERAALAKEINGFRAVLDSKQRALRRCRGERD